MGKSSMADSSVPGIGRLPCPAYYGNDPYIFVIYSHKDSALVFPEIKRLYDTGYNIWYDEGINPVDEWSVEEAEALKHCSVVFVMITPNSVDEWNVKEKIRYASSEQLPIVSVFLQETELSSGTELQLASFRGIK